MVAQSVCDHPVPIFVAHSKTWNKLLLENLKWQFAHLSEICGQRYCKRLEFIYMQGKQTNNQLRQQFDFPLAFMFCVLFKVFLGMASSTCSARGMVQKHLKYLPVV